MQTCWCFSPVRLVITDIVPCLLFYIQLSIVQFCHWKIQKIKRALFQIIATWSGFDLLWDWWISAMDRLSTVEMLVPVITHSSGTVCFAVYFNILFAASPIAWILLALFCSLYWKRIGVMSANQSQKRNVFLMKCKIYNLFRI